MSCSGVLVCMGIHVARIVTGLILCRKTYPHEICLTFECTQTVRSQLHSLHCNPVFLEKKLKDLYYRGMQGLDICWA